jgi:molecular chaperone GrpE
MSEADEQSQGPVIRDRRRIDPVTGQPRDPAPGEATRPPGKHSVHKPGDRKADSAELQRVQSELAERTAELEQVQAELGERTADVQRVHAEYANYRKRVDRDRVAVREQALASVLAELLPVLDDIGRAREHGELNGGFKAVAESLEAAVGKLGLTTFGEAGDAFDPNVHDALMHSYSPDVTEPSCVQILQPGYKVGERILRPARVSVAEPTDPAGTRPAADGAKAGKTQDGAADQEDGGDAAESADDAS